MSESVNDNNKLEFDVDYFQLPLGSLQTNCYVVKTGNENCVVIDPAGEAERILRFLSDKKLTLKKILLTHGHFDHCGACAELKKATGAAIYIHRCDEEMLNDSQKSLAYFVPNLPFNPVAADVLVKEGDVIKQDNVAFRVIETPGHSRGSVCYIAGGVIFAGDTIFSGSVGRTDCYSGDSAAQQESLQRLNKFEGDFTLCCGHGEMSTLKAEKMYNPYLGSFGSEEFY